MVDRWTRSPENRRLLSLPLRSVINLSEAVSKSLRNSYRSPVRRISLSPDNAASLSVSVANQTDERNYYPSNCAIVSFPPARSAGANCFQHRSTDSVDKWIPYLVIQFYRLSNSSLSLSFSRLLNNLPLGPRIDDSPPPGIRESTRIENLVLYTTTLVSKGRMVGKHEPFPAFQVAAQRRRT